MGIGKKGNPEYMVLINKLGRTYIVPKRIKISSWVFFIFLRIRINIKNAKGNVFNLIPNKARDRNRAR
jgi:hypothetical protein